MKTLAVLLCASFAAAPAAAQDARLEGRLDPVTLETVTGVIDSSRLAGLPVEPLVLKALEGSSKGASGERIVAAVRALGARLGTARDALGAASRPAELVAGAAALGAGADPAALTSLRRARTGNLDVPLAVLADLVGLGLRAEAATASILDLARSQAPDAEFLRLKQRQMERSRP